MKKIILILTICIATHSQAQMAEAQQLLLNWEKLAQMKKILQQLYEGYRILYKGYTNIKDLSQGNFSLHKNFLDGLLQVNPVVRNYKRVADIIKYESRIIKDCKAALQHFKNKPQFTIEEITHLQTVYQRLFKAALQNLDELAMILTAGKLRMTDEERLHAIDRLYESTIDQYAFLQDFNQQTALLAVQREKDQQEINFSQRLHGIK